MTNNRRYVYAGLAGEPGPGWTMRSGLYRMAYEDGEWEPITKGLPEESAVRALAVHPQEPGIVYAGTQDGPYRSDDHGDHWEKANVADHGLPVWSLLFHPRDPTVIYAGYESCEIYRSDDAGESWSSLPVSVRFPEVSVGPAANPAKRVLMMSSSIAEPDALYGALEVGGVIRSLDGGEHWENLSHGLYLDDQAVDTHGVLVSSLHHGSLLSITGAGMFRSADRGDHWLHVDIEPLNDRGGLYCRAIREVPGDPTTVWMAAGAGFDSDVGGLFRSDDGGLSWGRVDMGLQPKSSLFCLSFDERQPRHMWCSSYGGQVFASRDGGDSWEARPLPEGESQIYSLACG